jgi:hypothetical protein
VKRQERVVLKKEMSSLNVRFADLAAGLQAVGEMRDLSGYAASPQKGIWVAEPDLIDIMSSEFRKYPA